MNYGRAIKMLRVSRGLQQRQLAKQLDVDSSYISLLESGKRSPSLELLQTLGEKLHVPAYLILLLASDDPDLQGMDTKQAQKLGTELLRMFTSGFTGATK